MSKKFAQKAAELEKAIDEQIENNKNIFQDNKQLKMLAEALEKTKNDLILKYKSTGE